MGELNISKQGVNIKINTDTPIDKLKECECFPDTIFDGVDENNDGKVNEGEEMDTFKSNLKKAGYTVQEKETRQAERSQQKKSEGGKNYGAYNQTIQNYRNRYDADSLKTNFNSEEEPYEVKDGEKLYNIAKQAVIDDGLEATPKAINDRLAQIAAVNGINNVNNIRVGQRLIIHLTDSAKNSVQTAEGQNSAQALGGGSGAPVTSKSAAAAEGDAAADNAAAAKADRTQQAAEEGQETGGAAPIKYAQQGRIEVGESSYNFPKGPQTEGFTPVAPSDIEADFKKEDFPGAESITKWVKGEGDAQQVIYQVNYNTKVVLRADSVTELKNKHTVYVTARDSITDVPTITDTSTDEQKEAAVEVQKSNYEAVKKLIELSDGDIQTIRNIYDNHIDKLSDEDKAELTNELIKTRNADILNAVLFRTNPGDNNKRTQAVKVDFESAKSVVGIYQEILAKEKSGVKLTPEEIALRDAIISFYTVSSLHIIPADSNTGAVKKHVDFDTVTGEMSYSADLDGGNFISSDPEVFDEFVKEYNEANTKTNEEEKTAALQAVFEKYSKADKMLANSLAQNIDIFALTQEQKLDFINSSDAYVLEGYPVPDECKTEDDKAIAEAIIGKFRQAFETKDIGSTIYLKQAFDWIDKLSVDKEIENDDGTKVTVKEIEITAESGNKVIVKTEDYKNAIIALNFFSSEERTVLDENGQPQKDADGNEVKETVYTFTPNRRPTADEMDALIANIDDNAMKKAIVASTPIEFDNDGQYTKSIEDAYFRDFTSDFADKYEKAIDEMDSAEELAKFVEKLGDKYDYEDSMRYYPFDKIMSKLETFDSSNTEVATAIRNIKLELLKQFSYTDDNRNNIFEGDDGKTGRCTDANRLKLVQSFIKEGENGEKILDQNEEYEPSIGQLAHALPGNCKEGEAAEAYKTLFMNIGHDENADIDSDVRGLVYLMNHCEATLDDDMRKKLLDVMQNDVNASAYELVSSDKFKAQFWEKLSQNDKDKLVENFQWQSNTYAYMVSKLGVSLKRGEYIVKNGDKPAKYIIDSLIKEGFTKAQAESIATAGAKYISADEGVGTVYRVGSLARIKGCWYGEVLYNIVKPNHVNDDGRKILNGEGKYKNWIHPETIRDLISSYNAKATKDGEKHIMAALDNEVGPSKDEMNAIPKALLQYASGRYGMQDTDEYKALEAFVESQQGSFWDYGPKDAAMMDKLIDDLMAKL